jgi:hypothetical protein
MVQLEEIQENFETESVSRTLIDKEKETFQKYQKSCVMRKKDGGSNQEAYGSRMGIKTPSTYTGKLKPVYGKRRSKK